MKRVFLSHSSKDKLKVREIASFLKENGIYVWIDEAEIRIGDSLINKITDGILGVDYLFAFLSNNSINSDWVQKELELAMNLEIEEKRVVVVPILLEDCNIPGFLKNKLYADMRTVSPSKQEYSSLLRRLGIIEPPKEYKSKFTNREMSVVDFIECYNSLELDSDKLLLLQSILHEKQIFWFKAFLEFYNDVLLNIDTTSKEIFTNALVILKETVSCDDAEISARIRELINFANLLEKSEPAIIPVIISILSEIHYYNDKIFNKLIDMLNGQLDIECKDAIINYFCTILKKDWYNPDSDILMFSRKVFDMKLLKSKAIKKTERIAILTSNWTTDDHLKKILDIYFRENKQGKKYIIKALIESEYRRLIRDPKLKDRFYLLLNDVSQWDDESDERLVGRFLAYALSKRTEVFGIEQIYDVLADKSGYVLEYFLDYLQWHKMEYISFSEKEALIEKTVQLVKKSENPRKKNMMEQVLYCFYDYSDMRLLFRDYDFDNDEIHSWVEDQLR